nr:oligosaccharide repeat unit polymerase [Plesiomonas shigelloides]
MNNSRFPLRYAIVLLLLSSLSIILFMNTSNFLDGFLFFIGVGSILIFIFGKKNKDYFEPIYLFSIYYIFVYVSAFFTASTGFYNSIFIHSTYFYSDVGYVFTVSLFVCVVSYLLVLAGYFMFAKRVDYMMFRPIEGVASPLFLVIALGLFFLGVFNFLYNVFVFSGGSLINYYTHLSMRSYEFAQGGTTLFYNFLYAGSYMLFIRWLQENKSGIFAILFVFISVLVIFSTGRITNTIFYITSFLMIYYYNKGFYALNNKFFILGLLMAFLGVAGYAFRYASSLYFNGLYDFSGNGIFLFINDFFRLESLNMFLVNKGNIPNFALLMKVVDSWGRDLNYMFGSTLLFPLYGFISSDFFGLVPMPSVVAKQEWYSHIQGGNLPVTGMGEMIVNFSIVGFPLGMVLFGALGAFFRNLFIKTKSNIYIIFYANFCLFYLLYPKGEFNNFNLFWMAFPSIVFLLSVYLVTSLKSKNGVNNA